MESYTTARSKPLIVVRTTDQAYASTMMLIPEEHCEREWYKKMKTCMEKSRSMKENHQANEEEKREPTALRTYIIHKIYNIYV